MNKPHRWQDVRLKKALMYAPDADIKPSKATRQHILHTATQALQNQVINEPSRTAWTRLWNLFFAKPQMPWNTAFATFVVVGFVGLIWVVSNPQGTLDRPDTDLLSPTISQAPVPPLSEADAPQPAPTIITPSPTETPLVTPAPTATAAPDARDKQQQEDHATGATAEPQTATTVPRATIPVTLEQARQERPSTSQPSSETKEHMPMHPAPKNADANNHEVNAPYDRAPTSKPSVDATRSSAESMQEAPLVQGIVIPHQNAPGKTPSSSAALDAFSGDSSQTIAEKLYIEPPPQTPDAEVAETLRKRTDHATPTAGTAPVARSPTPPTSSEKALNTAFQQWDLAYISDGRAGTYVLSRELSKDLPALLQELARTALHNHENINSPMHNGKSNPAWILTFYSRDNTYLGTLSLQGRRWGFSNTMPCQLECAPIQAPLIQGQLSSQQTKNLAALLDNLAP